MTTEEKEYINTLVKKINNVQKVIYLFKILRC